MEPNIHNCIPSNKYIMRLDALDANLLQNTLRSNLNNTAPLWSANNTNVNYHEYFQFEIQPKTEATVSDVNKRVMEIPDTPIQQLAICHICNVKLPAAYLTDHEESLKHKAFLQITDIVLDRVRKHMLKKENTLSTHKAGSMYFCRPCVSEVPASDKQDHDKTKAHKHSVSLDRLLYELIALLTQDEEIDEPNLTTENSRTFLDNVKDIKMDGILESDKIEIGEIKPCLDLREAAIKIDEYIEASDNFDCFKSLTHLFDSVMIETPDGCKVIVDLNNFHGLQKIGNSSIQCNLCKTIIRDDKHLTSERHLRNVLKPLKDKNCIRNLQRSRSHCLICNEIIDDSDIHTLQNESHIENLKKAVIFDNNYINKSNPNMQEEINSMCEITTTNASAMQVTEPTKEIENVLTGSVDTCNELQSNQKARKETKSETTSNSPIREKAEIDGMKALNDGTDQYVCTKCNITIHMNNIKSHVNGSKHAVNCKSDLHYLLRQEEGTSNLVCRVCNVYVPDNLVEVKDHTTQIDHINKYKQILAINNVKRKKKDFFCNPCNVLIPVKNELYHIEKLSHQENLTNFQSLTDQSPLVENESVKSNDSQCNKSNSYLCEICNVYIPDNPKNISSHRNGNRHKNKLAEDGAQTERTQLLNMYQMEETENVKEVKCKVCKIIIPNRENNITEHIIGKMHIQKLDKIIKDDIETKGNKHFCKLCKSFIKKENLAFHVNQSGHISLKLKITPAHTSNETDKQNNSNVAKISADNECLVGNHDIQKVNNTYTKFKHHFMEELHSNRLICKVCFDVDIPNTPMEVFIHTSAKTHMESYNVLMKKHLIFETEPISTFFCGICTCLVPLKGEVDHAKGVKHGNNYLNATKATFCDICVESIDNMCMANHITTYQHIIRVKQTQLLLNYCEYCQMLTPKTAQHSSTCHKFAVRDKICFCTLCHPYLPGTSGQAI